MTGKKEQSQRAKDQAERTAQQLQKLHRRVAALKDGTAPKRLTNRQRLEAAANVGVLVKDVRNGGRSMTEICELLGERMPSKPGRTSVEPFRLHRWMLKGSATEVSEKLTAHYRDSPVPLRSTKTYLLLMEHLANLAGQNPLECQGALLTAVKLHQGRLQDAEGEVLPERRLADRLHNHAAVVARQHDLARLFQQAERVQAGWNIQRGPDAVVDLVSEASAYFSAREPVDRHWWLEIAAPPLPSVAIARIPFGFLPGPFRLTNDAGESRELPGHAAAYWELHLAIGPSGPLSVAPYLLRGTSVDLVLEGQAVTLPDQQDDIDQIVSGYPRPPTVRLDGRDWEVSAQTQPFYRSPRPGTDEVPPSKTVPNIHIEPVTAFSVRTWLMTSSDLVSEDGTWIGVEDRLEKAIPSTTGWVRAESIARSVEIALLDQRLDQCFGDWLERFRPNLDHFEMEWIDSTTNQDAVLRQRYAEIDLTGDEA